MCICAVMSCLCGYYVHVCVCTSSNLLFQRKDCYEEKWLRCVQIRLFVIISQNVPFALGELCAVDGMLKSNPDFALGELCAVDGMLKSNPDFALGELCAVDGMLKSNPDSENAVNCLSLRVTSSLHLTFHVQPSVWETELNSLIQIIYLCIFLQDWITPFLFISSREFITRIKSRLYGQLSLEHKAV